MSVTALWLDTAARWIFYSIVTYRLCFSIFSLLRQTAAAAEADPLAALPRSIDVRVWVTRPHLALVEFPMSQKSDVLMLEGERGIYYRWQRLAVPKVCTPSAIGAIHTAIVVPFLASRLRCNMDRSHHC